MHWLPPGLPLWSASRFRRSWCHRTPRLRSRRRRRRAISPRTRLWTIWHAWSGVISRTTDPRPLRSAAAVRNTAQRVLALAVAGSLEDWTVDRDRLQVADFVAAVVRERYPSLNIP